MIGAALIALVLCSELPGFAIGTAWLAFAFVLFEVGVRKTQAEFRFQAYALACTGAAFDLYFYVPQDGVHSWLWLGLGIDILYALLIRSRADNPLETKEQNYLEAAVAITVTSLSMLLVEHIAPNGYVGLLLCALSVLLLELGIRRLPAALMYCAYATGAIASGTVVIEQIAGFAKSPHIHVWVSYLGTSILLYILSERTPVLLFKTAASTLAVLFALSTLWLVTPNLFVPCAWACIALALFASGLRQQRITARRQAYATAVLSLPAAAWLDFPWTSIGVAGLCYTAELLCANQRTIEFRTRVFWSVLGTIALAAFLCEQFPGGLLTTAWGSVGVGLLIVGFAFRQRHLRLQGLTMLLVCIGKLFFYDLRNLEPFTAFSRLSLLE